MTVWYAGLHQVGYLQRLFRDARSTKHKSKVDRFQIDMLIVLDSLCYVHELRACRKEGAWLLSCFNLRTFG